MYIRPKYNNLPGLQELLEAEHWMDFAVAADEKEALELVVVGCIVGW